MKLNKILSFLIICPLTLLLLGFIIANRSSVSLRLNPFNLDDNVLRFDAPLFFWLFLSLILGFLLGGIVSKFTSRNYKKLLRKRDEEVRTLCERLQIYQDSNARNAAYHNYKMHEGS